MIEEVKKDKITFPGSPTKYEAGTLQTAEVVGFAESIRFLEEVGIKNIMEHEKKIMEYGLEQLKKNNSVKIIGNPKDKGSIMLIVEPEAHLHPNFQSLLADMFVDASKPVFDQNFPKKHYLDQKEKYIQESKNFHQNQTHQECK